MESEEFALGEIPNGGEHLDLVMSQMKISRDSAQKSAVPLEKVRSFKSALLGARETSKEEIERRITKFTESDDEDMDSKETLK